MARRLLIFNAPDRFVAGAIGEPGDRTFYLQARQGNAVASVALEKLQVAALAARLDDLLTAVADEAPAPTEVTADEGPLEEPVIDLFRVGAMALAWDSGGGRVVIEAQPLSEDGDYVEVPDDVEEGPDVLRVAISPAHAHEFVRRASALVAAGRPACPFCGESLEPGGHFCPKVSLN
ncbi:MAG TPA: DUF3090 domain-containing protein [Candidatus Limnocylindria bacterium]|nr:DUF3090 domain-containing protein [Candidatus Limnocylindria bacterium]